MVPQFLFTDSTGCVDFISQNKERNFRELLDGKEGVELRLGLGEPLKVGTVDKEDDTVDLREVVPPETAC